MTYVYIKTEVIKACVCYFRQKIAFQKLWELFFISSKNLFLFSRYSNFCDFFPPFPDFPDTKGQMEVESFVMSWIGLHKFAAVIFKITQLLYIISSNLVRYCITKKRIFLNLFRNLKNKCSLVSGPFCLW